MAQASSKAQQRFFLVAAVLGIIATLAIASAGPLYRFDFIETVNTAFRLFKYAAWLGVLAVVLLLISTLWLLVSKARSMAAASMCILALTIACLAVPLSMRSTVSSVPPIHDITTDTDDPPRFEAVRGLRSESDNSPDYAGEEIAAKQRRAYPDITTQYFSTSPKTVFDTALNVVENMGWQLHRSDSAEGRIEATAQTLWFGFEDDVVIRIVGADQQSEGATALDIRSASRVGISDLGKNAERIHEFLTRLNERLDVPVED